MSHLQVTDRCHRLSLIFISIPQGSTRLFLEWAAGDPDRSEMISEFSRYSTQLGFRDRNRKMSISVEPTIAQIGTPAGATYIGVPS